MADRRAGEDGQAGDPTVLRIGLVGCGRVAEHHARWIARTPAARLVAAMDPNPEAAAGFAARFGLPTHYTSLDALLATERLDVVHLTSPPGAHVPQVRASLEAGVHVLVEKPFTLSVPDAEDLCALAEQRGLALAVDFIQLFHPAYQRLRAAARGGAIGRVVAVQVYCGLDLNLSELRESWPPHWSYGLPGGVLHNYITHPLYLVAALLEGPFNTAVVPRAFGALPQDTTDQLDIQITGRSASASVTIAVVKAEGYSVRVHGTGGWVTADFLTHTFTSSIPKAGPQALNRILANPRLAGQLTAGTVRLVWGVLRGRLIPYQGLGALFREFYASVRGQGPPPIPRELILTVARLEEEVVRKAGGVRLSVAARPGRQLATERERRVLVTGGSGYLGRAVVRRLIEEGYWVRVLARPTSPIAPLEGLGVEIVFGDLRDEGSVREAVRGIGLLVNLAAGLRGMPEGMVRTGHEGTLNLARAARAEGLARVIHVSSLGVYDFSASQNRHRIDEQGPLEPHPQERSGATMGKLAAERVALEELRLSSAPCWTILRPSLLFGEGRDVVNPLGIQIGSWVVSLGRGGRNLRLIHVADVAEAIGLALRTEATRGQIYNLSHPDQLTARAYVRRFLKPAGYRLHIVHFPYLAARVLAGLVNAISRLRGQRAPVGARRLRYLFAAPLVDGRRFQRDTGWVPRSPLLQQLTESGAAGQAGARESGH